ncbi:hypothetical protein D3C73_1668570 [compost metagenome]
MDFVDIEGLKEKRITGQLFIVWSSEDTAESYALYFASDNNRLREYWLNKDGSIKESDLE